MDITRLYDYHVSYEKDDDTFEDMYESSEVLDEVKSFDLNTKFTNHKQIILVNEWYEYWCRDARFKAPRHIVCNPNGVTYKNILDNIPNIIIEGDHVFFESLEEGEDYHGIPIYKAFFGS